MLSDIERYVMVTVTLHKYLQREDLMRKENSNLETSEQKQQVIFDDIFLISWSASEIANTQS